MKPPFTFATDVITVTTTEFSLDKAAAGRIAVMSGVDFSKHGRNERMGAQSESRGYIPTAEQVETFCMLIKFLLYLAMFADGIQSIAARERIIPLQARLIEVAPTIREQIL